MFSNYPAGVSDSHPYFNPRERSAEVKCEGEESTVLPSFKVKERINELTALVENMQESVVGTAVSAIPGLLLTLSKFREEVEQLEDGGTWDCTFEGEVDLTEGQDGWEYDCPLCGETRSVDDSEEIDPDRAREDAWEAEQDMREEARRGN